MNLPPEFKSSKFRCCLYATVFAAVPMLFTMFNKALTPDKKQEAVMAFLQYVGIIWGVGIGGASLVDAADKYNPVKPSEPQVPPVQNVTTNINEGKKNG